MMLWIKKCTRDLQRHTRPDIAFLWSLVNQFMLQPKEANLQVVLRIV